jgi:hypothetical protein
VSLITYKSSAVTQNASSLAYPGAGVAAAGDLLVAVVGVYNGATSTSVTDTLGNSWFPLCLGNPGFNLAIWVAISIGSGANTVTFHGQGPDTGLVVADYSVAANFAVLLAGLFPSNGSTTLNFTTGGSINLPGVTSEYLAFMAVFDNGVGANWTVASGTKRQQTTTITGGESMAYGDQDTTGSITWGSPYTNSWTASASSSIAGVMGMIVTLPASGGGGAANYGYVA